MLQDMAAGRLENEFRNIAASPEETVLCFQQNQVLLSRGEDDSLVLPTLSQMADWETAAAPRYVFRLQGANCFLWTDAAPAAPGCPGHRGGHRAPGGAGPPGPEAGPGRRAALFPAAF